MATQGDIFADAHNSKPATAMVEDIQEIPGAAAASGSGHDPIVQAFPEGGFRAWASVFGAALCLFVGGVVSLSN